MPKIYSCRIRVRGYELDSFGHVNHAVYLNYLEHARWAMLGQEDITLVEIQRRQLWPVITGIEIRYLKPALMDEELEIRTNLISDGGKRRRVRMILEQNVFREDAHIVAAKVSSVVANASGRPVELPQEYGRLWSE